MITKQEFTDTIYIFIDEINDKYENLKSKISTSSWEDVITEPKVFTDSHYNIKNTNNDYLSLFSNSSLRARENQ